MAEQDAVKERLGQTEVDPTLFYDYEGRFIKMKREREQVAMLPRVIKPAMFARDGWELGDPRLYARQTVAPLSALTCRFVDLAPGARTDRVRHLEAQVAYVISGSGTVAVGQAGADSSLEAQNASGAFAAGDLVLIPPYTTAQFVAGSEGLRAWLPQVRLWHLLGLLWQDQLELTGELPPTVEAKRDASGRVIAITAPAGASGLQEDLPLGLEPDPVREAFFRGRRAVQQAPAGSTRYDWFLRRLAEENQAEREAPLVIRADDRPWEATRQGKLKFYVDRWSKVAARALDVLATEIEPHGHSGQHRHIFEELVLVLDGHGHDTQEGVAHQWQAGDLICIPPMTAHQHFNDGDTPARLVSVWSRQLGHEYLGGIEHISDASSWRNHG
jgi:quercetin dioxygenase-like cupin family protein